MGTVVKDSSVLKHHHSSGWRTPRLKLRWSLLMKQLTIKRILQLTKFHVKLLLKSQMKLKKRFLKRWKRIQLKKVQKQQKNLQIPKILKQSLKNKLKLRRMLLRTKSVNYDDATIGFTYLSDT